MMNEFLCGVLEGFYGRPWTMQQRLELFNWMQAWGMNTYMYGPKDDLKMRASWRELYNSYELDDLRLLLKTCQKKKIAFVYTIAPGLDMAYADLNDLKALKDKITQLLDEGVKHFCILFDDIPFQMMLEDEQRFGSFAKAQAYVSNELFDHIRKRVKGYFFFCPTDYCARMAKPSVAKSDYLCELGEHLHKGIDIFWTGPEIVSETIPASTIRELGKVLKRKPLIWENLHANDYDIRRVYLGPFSGRPNAMRKHVRGVLSNPNNEFETNFIPLRTLALYAHDERYNPRSAYMQALKEWLPRFKTHGKQAITLDDLELLADFLYLPFEQGRIAKKLLKDANYCLSLPPKNWKGERVRLEKVSQITNTLFDKLTELDNRDLLYSLYSYVWEVRHELLYLVQYLKWLEAGKPNEIFAKPDHLPNTYRTGVVAAIERLLPIDGNGHFYHKT